MEYFFLGAFSTAKIVGLILTSIAVCLLIFWIVITLGWKSASENSVWSKFALVAVIILIICILGGLANYFYQNIGWRA